MSFFLLALVPFSHPFWSSLPTPLVPRDTQRLSSASYASVENGIYMDGEVFSFSDSLSFELGGFDVSADLYYLGGGFMDSSIDSWHSFWGLPLGDRPNMPKNEVLMRFENNGNVFWEVSDSGFGISPFRVSRDLSKDIVFKAVLLPGFGPLDLFSEPSFSIYKKYKYGHWFGEYGMGWFGGVDIEGTGGSEFFSFSAFREKEIDGKVFNFGIMSSSNLWNGPKNNTLEGQITEAYFSALFDLGDHFLKIGFSEDLSVNKTADFVLFFEIFSAEID